jgi:hypothetical protein
MSKAARLACLTIALALAYPGSSAALQEDNDRYLLLATTRTSTMQDELDEAAAAGFRILTGSPTSGNEMAIFLERVAVPPATYEYRLLATTRTSTMEEELNEAATAGFRLIPSTMISKSRAFGPDEIVVVMEREPDSGRRFEYRFLATSRTSTLQSEALEAESDGFVLAGMVSRDEHMVIMEREVDE